MIQYTCDLLCLINLSVYLAVSGCRFPSVGIFSVTAYAVRNQYRKELIYIRYHLYNLGVSFLGGIASWLFAKALEALFRAI